jgi:D-methionine transport system substrate-binding protein
MWRVKFLLINIICLALLACTSKPRGDHEIFIGTITGPETQLMEVAKKVAAERYGLTVKIISFEDYIVPNTALADKEIDANMFQHQPYLDIVIEKKKYALATIGKMFIYPMGVYSSKFKNITDLPDHAVVGIPNDPSNGARALRLLAKAQLISIPDQINDLALSPKKIIDNPRHLVIKEIPAAQLPRVLNDIDAAVINTNYAVPAGLIPHKHALLLEDKDSPYANIVVVRANEKDEPKYHQLMEALHSNEVVEEAKKLFGDHAIAAW